MTIDKVAIARRKGTRGQLLSMLYQHQSAALTVRTMEYALMTDNPHISSDIGELLYYLAERKYIQLYDGDEPMSLVRNPSRDNLVRITADGVDLMEETIEDKGVLFGDPSRQ